MTYQEALQLADELKARFDAGFSTSEKESIAKLYVEVLRKELKRTNCNDCYRDALIEVCNYLKREKKMKEKCAYSLTDEAAESYLKKFPKQIQMFAQKPENWEERIGKTIPEDLNEELVSEIAEKLKEGITKRQIREDYKGYLLGEKKLTNKLLESYLKAASEKVDEVESDDEKSEE